MKQLVTMIFAGSMAVYMAGACAADDMMTKDSMAKDGTMKKDEMKK